jgi:hypothetical protein
MMYCFGDASGSGGGWCIDFGDGVWYELGEMFLKKDGSFVRAIDFEEALVDMLTWIQQNTVGVIPLTIGLWEDFGV